MAPSPELILVASVLQPLTGYVGGVALAAILALIAIAVGRRPGRITTAVQALGQRSLTLYLLQSVIFLVVFAGFGLQDRVGMTGATVVAVLTWLVSLGVAELLRRAGRRGPAEYLLRRSKGRNGDKGVMVGLVAPAVGNLQLALTSGVSVSEVTNALAQSQAEFLNLGLIGTTLTAESCSGSDPVVAQEDLPRPIRVDNRGGDARETQEESGLGLLGFRDVQARVPPQSSALTQVGNLDIDGLISVSAVRSHAETTVLDGQGREARAYAEVDLSIGPLSLKGLRWDAVHRTGAA
jgi:hypothetical protein